MGIEMAMVRGLNIGSWYRTSDSRLFEVVAVDRKSIEIQYEDGALEELDLDSWLYLRPEPDDPPSSEKSLFDVTDDNDYEYDRHTLYDVLGNIEHEF